MEGGVVRGNLQAQNEGLCEGGHFALTLRSEKQGGIVICASCYVHEGCGTTLIPRLWVAPEPLPGLSSSHCHKPFTSPGEGALGKNLF